MEVIDTLSKIGVLFSQPSEFYTDDILDLIEQKYNTPDSIIGNTKGVYYEMLNGNFNVCPLSRAFRFTIRTENVIECKNLIDKVEAIEYTKPISPLILDVVITKLKRFDLSVLQLYTTTPSLVVFEYICKNKVKINEPVRKGWVLSNQHVLLATYYNCRDEYDLGPNPFGEVRLNTIKNHDERNSLGQTPLMYHLIHKIERIGHICKNLNAEDNTGKRVVFYMLDHNPILVKNYSHLIDFNVTYKGDTPLTYTKLKLDVALKIKCNPDVINNDRHVLTMCPDYPLDKLDLSLVKPIFGKIIEVQPINVVLDLYLHYSCKMTLKQKITLVKSVLNGEKRDIADKADTMLNYNLDREIYIILLDYWNLIVCKFCVNSYNKETGDCCVCFENKPKVPMECGHDICGECVVKIENDKCPVCRQSLTQPHSELCL
jgi:hypothetical protein